MVESARKTCMLLFVRHGERMDQVPNPTAAIDYKFDPPLTELGMKQAADAAKIT